MTTRRVYVAASISLMADRPGIRWIESVEAFDSEEWSRNREAAE